MISLRHVVVALGLAAGLAFSASAGTIYLKDGATGDGSGSSWANACSNIADAVTALNASSDSPAELRVAGGVYPIKATQTITHPNFLIRGGWRAQSDGDTECDSEEYQSIVCGTTGQQWSRFNPVTATETGLADMVIVDGKIHYPDMTGQNEYTFCHRRHSGYGLNQNFITVSAAGGGEMSGLVFVGCRTATVITITGNGPGTVVSNCLFTANDGAPMISLGATTVPSHVTHCTFKYNYGDGFDRTGVNFGGGACYLENSTFDGVRIIEHYNSALCDFGSSANVVSNCVFRRCYFSGSAGGMTSYLGHCCVFRPRYNNPQVYDTVIAECFTRSPASSPFPAPIVGAQTGRFIGLLVTNNVCQCYVTGRRSYSAFTEPYRDPSTVIWSNCVFVANKTQVMGKMTSGTTYTYADGEVGVATLGNGVDGGKLNVYGCVFNANEIILPEDPETLSGLTVVPCRGVLLQAVAEGKTSAATVDHCTFLGPETNGVYDIAQFGVGHTKAFTLRNSIFQLTDENVYETPFYVAVPVYKSTTTLFAPENVTIQNLTVQPSSDYTVTGLAYDKVPLNADYEPLARTPDLLTTTDGLPRGAKPLAAGVAAGHTLTVRREPLDGGAITSGGTQSVATDDEIVPVTAAVAAGSGNTFAGWFYDGASTPITTEATLSGVTLTEDKVVVAKFSTRPVAVTFDLDGKGTFASTGTDQFTTNTNAGLDFPVCAEPFTMSDGWLFVKWNDTPVKVPSDVDAVTVGAKIVTTDVRTVYLTPTGAGEKDGTSWANAYGDLQTAIDDAAICRGEVWAQEGVYKIPAQIDLKSNVALRGGFAGDETSADEADPAAHETIFTGDLALDDYWTTNTVWYAKIFKDGKVTMPANDNDSIDVIWRHAFSTTPTGVGFSDELADPAATNVAFSGVSFACFFLKAVSLKSGSTASFDDCRFLACGGDWGYTTSSGALSSSGQVSIDGCRFTCNYRAAVLGAGVSVTNRIASSTFEYGHTVYCTCGLSINGAAPTVITNVVFRRNNALNNQGYSAPASALEIGRSASSNVRVIDSRFEKNHAENNGMPTVMIRDGSNSARFDRCRFSENRYKATGAVDAGYNMGYVPGTPGIGYLSDKTLFVRDTVFETNVLTVAIAAGSVSAIHCDFASAIGVGGTGWWSAPSFRILNCAFVGNSAVDTSGAALPFPVGTVTTGYSASNTTASIVHCLFKDNTVTSPRAAGDVAFAGWPTETLSLLDNVLWSAAADYVPFAFDHAPTPQLWGNVVKNFDADVFAAADAYSYSENIETEAPLFDAANPLRLRGASSGARCGTPVYETSAGAWYFKDVKHFPSKPWRNAMSRTSTAASVSGLSETPVPDLADAARSTKRVSCGPLNAPPITLRVIVR